MVQSLGMAKMTLHELIAAGALAIGSDLYHPSRASRREAKVVLGGIQVGGKVYPSPSSAARAASGYQTNGWVYWRLATTGKVLADLR